MPDETLPTISMYIPKFGAVQKVNAADEEYWAREHGATRQAPPTAEEIAAEAARLEQIAADLERAEQARKDAAALALGKGKEASKEASKTVKVAEAPAASLASK